MPQLPTVSAEDATAEFGDPSYPDFPTLKGTYSIRSLWRVTEWRGGTVFRTQFIRHLWWPLQHNEPSHFQAHGETFMIGSVSTTDQQRWMEAGHPVFKTII